MIITLSGSNHFLLHQELSRLVADFTAKYGDINVEKHDGEETELERITEAIHSLPFLASSKLVVLRSPSTHKAFMEQFEELVAAVPEATQVIIVEPKLDKRSSYHKFLKKLTDFKEFSELDEQALSKWLAGFAKDKSGSISLADAEYLVNRLGPNQQLLFSEISKLLNFQPQITRQNIDLLTEPTPQSTVFELLDAAMAGNTKKALELYDQQRQQKVEPLNILAMIAWQLHILALVKTAGERSVDEIASVGKIHPFVVRKSLNTAGRLSLKRIKELVRQALEVDIDLKTKAVDPDEMLKNYLLKLGNSN